MGKISAVKLQSNIALLQLSIERKETEIAQEIDKQKMRVQHLEIQLQQSNERSAKCIERKNNMIVNWKERLETLKGIQQRLVENESRANDDTGSDGYTERVINETLESIRAEQEGTSESQGFIRLED